jgi:ABC-type branched-subunit amino acid transport system substrate-binding protein
MPTYGRALAALTLPTIALIAACGGGGGGSTGSPTSNLPTVTIGVIVPTSADPYVAQFIKRGAQQGVNEANSKGGITVGGHTYQLALKIYDDAGQVQQSAAAVDSAIHDGAVAILEDGLGASISAAHSQAAGVPEIDIANGDVSLLDPQNRPSLFRLGIANDAAANRLSAYITQSIHTLAILHDDTSSGRDGATQLTMALATAGGVAGPNIEAASGAPTLDTQIQQITGSGAGGVVIWGTDSFVGKAVAAMHAAGVTLPLFAGPTGESPAVRAVAGNAATDGLRFVSSRVTSEADASSFGQFEHRLAAAQGGPTDAGFKNAAGEEIRQPNDFDFYAYDAVNLVAAALKKQGSVQPGAGLITAIGSVNVPSANGDTRGFNPQNHEGIADDDMYIAVIHDMQFTPVKDEQLSKTLPAVDQILGNFH